MNSRPFKQMLAFETEIRFQDRTNGHSRVRLRVLFLNEAKETCTGEQHDYNETLAFLMLNRPISHDEVQKIAYYTLNLYRRENLWNKKNPGL